LGTAQSAQSDPPLPDSVECVTGCKEVVQRLKRLRLRQPAAPLMAIEFYNGSFDAWGGEHNHLGPEETARRAMEILGCGSQLNYYMYHGGTNFGFWGSRLSESSASYETTSYDYDAPIAEGGGLTRKYYLTRLVNLLANHMGRFLAPCSGQPPPVTVHDSTAVLNLSGPEGSWAVVTNNGRSEITSARICLPDGRDLTVPLAPIGAAAVPRGLQLAAGVTLDYANLTPLGLFGQKLLVLHGPAGGHAEQDVEVRARIIQHLVVHESLALHGHVLARLKGQRRVEFVRRKGHRPDLFDADLVARHGADQVHDS